MLAKLIVDCAPKEMARVGQFMLDTGLSQNNTYYHQEPAQVHGDWTQYFKEDQAAALMALRASPGVGQCKLVF